MTHQQLARGKYHSYDEMAEEALRLFQEREAEIDGIAEKLRPAAERYIRALRERYEFYTETPFIGQAEPSMARRLGLAPDQVRSFLYRNHQCYYTGTDKEIRVASSIHAGA